MRTSVVGLFLLLCAFCCAAQTPTLKKIEEIRSHLGETVNVEGRTGQIEKNPPPGVQIFTLRDNYGDVVYIRERAADFEKAQPIMGVHYKVTGTSHEENGRIVLDVASAGIQRDMSLYPPAPEQGRSPIVWGAIVVLGIGLAGVYLLLRPKPVWGHLIVTHGSDKNAKPEELPLRGNRIEIGREATPRTGLRILPEDNSVHRHHAFLIRQRKGIFYENLHDKGSRVDGEMLEAGEKVALRPGMTILIGKIDSRLEFRPIGYSPHIGFGVTITDPDMVLMGGEETAKDSPMRGTSGRPTRGTNSADAQGTRTGKRP